MEKKLKLQGAKPPELPPKALPLDPAGGSALRPPLGSRSACSPRSPFWANP